LPDFEALKKHGAAAGGRGADVAVGAAMAHALDPQALAAGTAGGALGGFSSGSGGGGGSGRSGPLQPPWASGGAGSSSSSSSSSSSNVGGPDGGNFKGHPAAVALVAAATVPCAVPVASTERKRMAHDGFAHAGLRVAHHLLKGVRARQLANAATAAGGVGGGVNECPPRPKERHVPPPPSLCDL
jgi:hypothetical protein